MPVTPQRWDPKAPLLASVDEEGATGITRSRLWFVMRGFFRLAADVIGTDQTVQDNLRHASSRQPRSTFRVTGSNASGRWMRRSPYHNWVPKLRGSSAWRACFLKRPLYARALSYACVVTYVYKALQGRAASTGCRQSNPSSRRPSCALVSETTPPSARGQAKRPRSSCLANRHSPPSRQYRHLMRFAGDDLDPLNQASLLLNSNGTSVDPLFPYFLAPQQGGVPRLLTHWMEHELRRFGRTRKTYVLAAE